MATKSKTTVTPASTPATEAPAKKPRLPMLGRKPRLTAAERREANAAKAAAAKAALEAQQAQFEQQRPLVWLQLWAKALRLDKLMENYQEVRDSHSWWFEDFTVDARNQCFSTETLGGHSVSESRLYACDVERLNEGLDMALGWLTEYDEEQERKRQEALVLEQKRAAARAKLTAEDMKVLGLR